VLMRNRSFSSLILLVAWRSKATIQSSKKQEKPLLDQKETAVLAQIKKIDLLDMTPLEAMNELYRLQKKLKKG
ncbi:hypothetical protein N3930_40520, partial [Bacillus thuringiensis]|nr:hypothetical protein [Bacillus thuringiensis]